MNDLVLNKEGTLATTQRAIVNSIGNNEKSI